MRRARRGEVPHPGVVAEALSIDRYPVSYRVLSGEYLMFVVRRVFGDEMMTRPALCGSASQLMLCRH